MTKDLSKELAAALAACRVASVPDYGKRLRLAETALEEKALNMLPAINAGDYDTYTEERFRSLVQGGIFK